MGEYSAEEAQPEDSESEEPLLEEYAAAEPSSDVSVAEPPLADSELEQEEEGAAPSQEALEEVSQPISAPELAESDDDDAEAGPLGPGCGSLHRGAAREGGRDRVARE